MRSEKNTQGIGGIRKEEILRKAKQMEARMYLQRMKVTGKEHEHGRQQYEELIASGMAWEFHPWLTGYWKDDKERFLKEVVDANKED